MGPRAGLDVLENKKTLSPAGIRSPDRPARRLVAIPSTLLHNKIPLLEYTRISAYRNMLGL